MLLLPFRPDPTPIPRRVPLSIRHRVPLSSRADPTRRRAPPRPGAAGQAKFLRTVSDFTLGRIEQFDARIRDCVAERERRRGVCQEAVAAIGALWDCLGVSEASVPPPLAEPRPPPPSARCRRLAGIPRAV